MAENAYIESFLKSLKDRKYSRRTLRTYRYPLHRLFRFLAARGIDDIREVTAEDLELFRRDLIRSGMTSESMITYTQAVRRFFGYLEDAQELFVNPAAGMVLPPRDKRLPVVPTVEELRRLLECINVTTAVGIRDRAMVETAYSCGLRLNELLSLTLFSVDFSMRSLRVMGKGRRERVLPLGGQALKWLEHYVGTARKQLTSADSGNVLWLNVRGTAASAQCYQKMLKRCRDQAGISTPVTGHTLRRACATHMLQNGAQPVVIQHLLGHADLTHLSRYLRLTVSELKQIHSDTPPGK